MPSHKKTSGIFERTLRDIVSLLKESVSRDEIAQGKGLLQGCDPRYKLVSIAVLLASALIARKAEGLFALYIVVISLALASSVSLTFFLKRTLFFIPIFSLLIVLPAIFGFVTPGKPVASFNLLTLNVTITAQGLSSAGILLLRILDSVSLAILLVLTTKQHTILKVLRVFRVPQLFIMTMGMTWRYIYLLLDIVQNSFIAIRSRVGYVTSAKTGRRIIGANIGTLWLKSYRLQNQVYDAMISRGYTGEPKVLEEFTAHAVDFILLAITIFIFAGTICLNHYTR